MFGIDWIGTIFILVWCIIPVFIGMCVCIYARGSLYLIFASIVMMCVYPTILMASWTSLWLVIFVYCVVVGIPMTLCFWLGYGRYECEAIGRNKILGVFFCSVIGMFWWVFPLAPAVGIARFPLEMRNRGWGKERVVRKEPEGTPPDWRAVRDEEAD